MRAEPHPQAIAIVGIGCRLPGGADDPERFWKLLCDGVDTITEIPPDRFDVDEVFDPDPGRQGKIYTRWGGFLDRVDEFDADFFGIAPREARRMDPQQRLLLEVVWEALENGGHPPDHLAGSNTGVFVGISSHDYTDIQVLSRNRHRIDAHINAGGAACIAANRISYLLDLRGPSLAVDTACSSSLTAVHLACRSISAGECDLAIVGGVNVLLAPEVTIGFCRATMLSPDGRCHAFDARANGYVRGEGAGAVILKPLAQARRDGDPIHAVIRGSAVNQDGRTPGLSLPSAAGQEAMLRQALREAGVPPSAIQYVEAHGTGTSVGDPIEAAAIGRVFSGGRRAGEHCLMGSVKTNLGHLEAGAGIAGLIKAALALQHRAIPPNLHFSAPNPAIPFEQLRLRVPTSLEPWPETAAPAMAGVNSFGFGGANAHVVLEEPPPPEVRSRERDAAGAHLLTLSARTPEALRELAGRHARRLATGGAVPLHHVCYTAAVRRMHHEHCLAAVGGSHEEMVELLEAFRAGEERADLHSGRCPRGRQPGLAFVFTGMGPQWWGMGRQLMREEPVFRAAVAEVDALLGPLAGWSLLDELAADEAASRITETSRAHVANFAVQLGLAALWRSWGIVPDAVVGHSSGEMAAAYVAGALTLPSAVRLAFHRGRLQQRTAGTGRMLAAAISADEASRLIAGLEGRVSLAALNAPASVTLSGEAEPLERIAATLAREQRFCRFLAVEVPYHGPQMEAIREELLLELGDLAPARVAIPLVSEVTGELVDGPELDAAYWWRNVREPVRFAAAVDRLAGDGIDLFVEVGPHPVLAGAIGECFAHRGHAATVLPSLRRGEDERRAMLRSLAGLHVRGRTVQWSSLYPSGACVPLPTYPWQRERHWFEPEAPGEVAPPQPAGTDSGHPLLGRRLHSPHPVWEVGLGEPRLDYLEEHRVQESVVFPAAGYLEMVLAAAGAVWGQVPVSVERAEFRRLLFLPRRADSVLQLLYDEQSSTVRIHSAARDGASAWTPHASAVLRPLQAAVPDAGDPGGIRGRCAFRIDPAALYDTFEGQGLRYGPAFRGIRDLWRGEGEALGRIALDPGLEVRGDAYRVHPALLDAAFQVLGCAAWDAADAEGPMVPVSLARLEVHDRPGAQCWAHAAVTRRQGGTIEGEVRLLDDAGRVLLHCRGIRLQSLAGSAQRPGMADWLYEMHWEEVPLRPRSGPSAGLPPPPTIGQAVRAAELRADEATALRGHYAVAEPALHRIALHHVRAALQKLGWAGDGDGRDPDSLAAALGIAPRHRRFFARLLQILRAEAEAGNGADDPGTPPDALAARVLAEHPEQSAEFELLQRCGSRLDELLRGDADPREVLFGDSFRALSRLYRSSPISRYYNELAAEAVSAAARGRESRAPLRILEIGAGTGGLTSAVLPRLRAAETEYHFTDLSPFFLARAREEFEDRPGMRFGVLDVEQDPEAQGYPAAGFDVVLGANVVHATADVRRGLGHLRRLLAPGGLLVLVEATRRAPWFDLIFGLLDGWWRFADHDLRPAHPLLLQDAWLPILAEAGFEEATVLADPPREGGTMESVLLARAPVAPPLPSGAAERRRWLLFADRSGVGARLGAALRERGDACVLVRPGVGFERRAPDVFEIAPGNGEDPRRLLEALHAEGAAIDGVLHLWGLDAPPVEGASAAEVMDAQQPGCGGALDLIHALQRTGRPADVWLVTSGAQAVDGGGAPGLAQSPLWGLGRVLRNEQPELRPRLVDLSPRPTPEEIGALVAELHADEFAAELALRGRTRWVCRLRRATLREERRGESAVRVSPDVDAFRLQLRTPGALDTLELRSMPRPPPPPPGHLTVRVLAAGLNFRDVMLALGMLPPAVGDGGTEAGTLSIECAGVVTACGEGVDTFRPGDPVIALAVGALGSHAVARQELVVRKPAHLSFEEAASIPGAHLTARYALIDLARLQAGERVLIHAASGGVGHAALRLCQRAGAEIFATAGTPEKREYLRSLGVEHVMDSRSLAWADEVLERTGGEGVDVVLNSLAGEAIPRGLQVLRPFGRFVEIGKRDIYEDAAVGLLPFRKSLAFFSVDLVRLCDERPAVAGALLRGLVAQVDDGELELPPRTAFDVAEAEQAYRLMAQARHIGKVVLTLRQPEYAVRPEAEQPLFHPDATYLITGGLGGFGLAVAEWMVRQGAGHLVLMSRSGTAKDNEQALRRLGASAAGVHVVRGDVAREEDVARTLATIRAGMPPLRGVMHLAMVLDDALLGELDQERFRRVMQPKIAGAWNLHRLTAEDPLDHFVLFSSIASVIGHPLQGNYAAANSFLDSLAAYRRARGRPGVAISWGTVAEVGYVSRHEAIQRHLSRQGIESFSPAEALAALDHALRHERPHLVAARLEWSILQKWNRNPSDAAEEGTSPAEDGAGSEEANEAADLLRRLRGAEPEEIPELLESHLLRRVARVLGTTPQRVDPEKPLTEMGLDSLLAVELLTALKLDVGVQLPVVVLLQGTSTRELVGLLLQQLALPAPPVSAARPLPAEGAGEHPRSSTAPLAPRTADLPPPAPLSSEQRRFWYLDHLSPGNPAYNLYAAARLSGQLDGAALQRSLQEVVRRHEVLRASFSAVEGVPLRVTESAVDVPLPLRDLRHLPSEEREAELQRIATAAIRQPFDLGRAPLLRGLLVRVDEDEHAVLLVVHHIACDAWGMTLLVREVMALYRAFRQGLPSPLPEVSTRYLDYARLQEEALTREGVDAQLAYWRRQLGGARAALDLPSDRPRPAVPTFRGGHVGFELSAELSEALRELGRREGVTLFTLLLAAFQGLLSRHCGEHDIAVGTPVSTRTQPGTEDLVGCCMNTLVLRTDLSGDPSLGELLQRARQVSLGALAHQDLPFDRVVEALRPWRDASHSPLFRSMLILHNLRWPELRMDGLAVRPLEVESGASTLDLTLLVDTGERLHGSLEYSADLFDRETAARMLAHFQVLLEAMVADPTQRLSSVALLTPMERSRLLEEWTGTSVDFGKPRCVHELVEVQAGRTPDATAVVYEGERLTYRELDQRANRLARQLRRLGVGPEDVVGVCLERSPDLVVSLLAILKAGGGFLPMDPGYPQPRLASMLADAKARVLITRHLPDGLVERTAPGVSLLAPDDEVVARERADALESGATPDSLAYVIYTSGSAGEPKGVAVPHGALWNQVQWRQYRFPLTEGDAVLQRTPIGFDPSIWEFFGPLAFGARLVLPRPGSEADAGYLARLTSEHAITTLQVVPSLLGLLLEQPDLGRCRTLRRVLCGGEPLPRDLQERFFARIPAATLHNLYGPAEATIDATCWTCRPDDPRPTAPIGRPIANVQVYVLDPHLQPVPPGVPGELYIGGSGLARGYLNRPDLTLERFIPHPHAGATGARLYRTGDIARWSPDGSIEFLGRLDAQVKIRGSRVEPAEVEAAICQYAGVREALVTTCAEPGGGSRLVARLVAEPGRRVSVEDLHTFLAARLPGFMVPAPLTIVDALPRLPSGKLDRRASDTSTPAPLGGGRVHVAPRDAVEIRLTRIWEQIFAVRPIGVTDDFFDLGGHSLLAMRFLAQVHAVFGRELPVSSVVQERSIERLARLLREDSTLPASPVVPIQPRGSRPPLFLVHPTSGTVACYVNLARHLGEDQPVYGIQAPGMLSDTGPLDRIEDMAAHYVEAVRAVQPKGPYRLGGWSMGGVVAFEMARQLDAQGSRVATLALFDAWPAGELPMPEAGDAWLLGSFMRSLGLAPEQLATSMDGFWELDLESQLAHLLSEAQASDLLPTDLGLPGLRRHLQVFACNLRAMRAYVPQPYPGRLALFPAAGGIAHGAEQPSGVWEGLARGGVDVHAVPADHHTLLDEPGVRVVAQHLAACLDGIPALTALPTAS